MQTDCRTDYAEEPYRREFEFGRMPGRCYRPVEVAEYGFEFSNGQVRVDCMSMEVLVNRPDPEVVDARNSRR